MPSTTKTQRRLMGWANACSKGKAKNCDNPKVKKITKTMKPEDLHDFAATKEKGLPEKADDDKKDESFWDFVDRKIAQVEELNNQSLWGRWKNMREASNQCSCNCAGCKAGDCSKCTCENCTCAGCSCSK